MTRYRIDYEVAEDFGEPMRKTCIVTCAEDKSGAEVLTDFLKKFDKTVFTSLSMRKEHCND